MPKRGGKCAFRLRFTGLVALVGGWLVLIRVAKAVSSFAAARACAVEVVEVESARSQIASSALPWEILARLATVQGVLASKSLSRSSRLEGEL